MPKRTMIRYARNKEQNEGREIAPISALENHIEKHNPLKRTEMPSVAEWDSIYNKSLEMISVRFFSPSLMGIEMGGYAAKYKLWDCFERLIPRNDREIKRRQNLIEGLKREKAGLRLNCDL